MSLFARARTAVSVTGNAGIGMPIILLHDAEGGIITVEMKNGEVCRGVLDEAEDSMNLVLKVTDSLFCLTLTPFHRVPIMVYMLTSTGGYEVE